MLQRLVAGGVAERVVELLEMVDVDIDERGCLPPAPAVARPESVDLRLEFPAIVEPRQRIEHRALLRGLHGTRCREPRPAPHHHPPHLLTPLALAINPPTP